MRYAGDLQVLPKRALACSAKQAQSKSMSIACRKKQVKPGSFQENSAETQKGCLGYLGSLILGFPHGKQGACRGLHCMPLCNRQRREQAMLRGGGDAFGGIGMFAGLSCRRLHHRATLSAQNLGCCSLVKPGPKGQWGGSVGCASMR